MAGNHYKGAGTRWKNFYKLYIQVDSWGLEVITLFKRVEISWREIDSSDEFEIRNLYGYKVRTDFRISSKAQKLVFNDSIEGVNDLVATVDDMLRMQAQKSFEPICLKFSRYEMSRENGSKLNRGVIK